MEIKYKSVFKNSIKDLILYEKAMNFKHNDKLYLHDLDNYFLYINKKNKNITEEDFNNYIYNFEGSSIDTHKRYLIILKFCKFLIRFGNTNIFYEEINFDNNNSFQPHIYSEDEMKKILLVIDNRNYGNNNFSYEYPVLFRLLYSTGLRISEALNIKYNDIDLDDNSINITLSKENISRKIYFSNSMKKVIIKYFKVINFNENDYIFTTTKANALLVFKNVVKKLDIKLSRIRLHDLRHSFSVTAFDKLIKKNIEPEEALLYLEKFMGHSNISSTEYYLHMTDKMKQEITDTMKKQYPDLYPKIKDGIDYE
mgnify:FL=1